MEFKRFKFLIWLIVAGVLPLLGLTGYLAKEHFLPPADASKGPEEVLTLAGQQSLHIAEAVAERADRLLDTALAATEKMAAPKLASMLAEDLESGLSSQPRNNPGLLSVYAARGIDGKTVYTTNEQDVAREWKDDPAFKAATNPDKPLSHVSTVQVAGTGYVIQVTVPVVELKPTFGPGGLVMKRIPVGALIGVWNWLPVVESVQKISIGTSGGAFLVDEKTLVLAGPAADVLKMQLSADKGLAAVLTRLAGNNGAGVDRAAFRNQPAVVSAHPCRRPGWWGVVHVSEADVLKGIGERSILPVAVAGGLLVVSLLLCIIVWNRLTAPLSDLAHAIARVSEGNLAIAPLKGSAEYSAMVTSFTTVVGRMKALNDSNVNLTSTKEELNRKVDELSGQVKELGDRLETGVASANRQMNEKIERLTALREADGKVSRAQTMSEALQTITSEMAKAFEFDTAFTLVADDEKGTLGNAIVGPGVAASVVRALKIPLGSEGGIAARVLRDREAARATDDLDAKTNRSLIAGIGSRNFAVFPVVLGSTAVAVMVFGNADGGRRVDDKLVSQVSATLGENLPGLEKIWRLVQLQQSLTVVNAMKNDSVHTISKELHAALGIIKNYVSSLLDSSKQRINEEEFLGMVMNRSVQLERLIDDLVNFSQLDALDSSKMEKLNLGGLLKSLGTTYQVQAQVKGVTFEQAIPDLPEILGEKARISLAFTSLISNAIKVSLRGGKVTVRAQPSEDQIEVMVGDSGIGIGQEHLPRVFTTFHGPDEVENDLKGTGLKLPLARRIVESHKGKVWVESETGKGSRFYLLFPIAK